MAIRIFAIYLKGINTRNQAMSSRANAFFRDNKARLQQATLIQRSARAIKWSSISAVYKPAHPHQPSQQQIDYGKDPQQPAALP